jgi:hypothetical protein
LVLVRPHAGAQVQKAVQHQQDQDKDQHEWAEHDNQPDEQVDGGAEEGAQDIGSPVNRFTRVPPSTSSNKFCYAARFERALVKLDKIHARIKTPGK